MDSYWLIERMVIPEVGWFQVAWLSLGSRNRATESTYIHEWTTDTKDAIRFPRQQDAEKILELLFPLHCSYSVTEHMDMDSSHPGIVPGWVQISAAMAAAEYAWQHDDWDWSAVEEGLRSRLRDADWLLACELAAAPKGQP